MSKLKWSPKKVKSVQDSIMAELVAQKDNPISASYGDPPRIDEGIAAEREHMARAKAEEERKQAAWDKAHPTTMTEGEFRQMYPSGKGKHLSPPPVEYSEALPKGTIKNGKVVLANTEEGEGVALSQETASVWDQAWAAEKAGTLGEAAPAEIKKKLKKKKK